MKSRGLGETLSDQEMLKCQEIGPTACAAWPSSPSSEDARSLSPAKGLGAVCVGHWRKLVQASKQCRSANQLAMVQRTIGQSCLANHCCQGDASYFWSKVQNCVHGFVRWLPSAFGTLTWACLPQGTAGRVRWASLQRAPKCRRLGKCPFLQWQICWPQCGQSPGNPLA